MTGMINHSSIKHMIICGSRYHVSFFADKQLYLYSQSAQSVLYEQFLDSLLNGLDLWFKL